MKITAIRPFCVGYAKRNMFMLKVETDSGIHGWGEGGISGREGGMAAIAQSLAEVLIGEDPLRVEHLWQLMFRGGFFESGTVMSGAISAIDLALWDIQGKALKVPCWQLLGGRSRERIECYVHCKIGTVTKFLEAGWKALRLEAMSRRDGSAIFDPDEAVQDVVEDMHKAREIAGPAIKLMVDFHTRFNPPAAALACNAIQSMRPLFVEDPLRAKSPKAYVSFRTRTAVPLASGEACASKWEFQQLIEEDAIDYARIDICNVGGLTEARKVAAMAETHYIDVVPHNPLGPLSSAACVHLSAALPNFTILEYGHGMELSPDLFVHELNFKLPHYEIPQAPGLGVDVREENLKKYPMKPWTTPRLQRPDGGFCNW